MKYFAALTALGLASVVAACAPAEPEAPETTMAASEPVLVTEVMTEASQAALTPAEALAQLKAGNQRFVEGRLTPRDYGAQAAATASGQYPKAAVLSCLDSRVPPEIVFDQGIGDLFVGRVAGNFENEDLLGSLEFATAVANVPLIVVLGHTSCGAIQGAVAGVELGNLTAMLDNFDEVLAEVRRVQEMAADESNDETIRLAIEENVRKTVADILVSSQVMTDLVESGELMVVGGVYDLASGQIQWMDS